MPPRSHPSATPLPPLSPSSSRPLLRCLVRILRHLSSGLKSRRARQGGTSLTFIIYDRYFSRPPRIHLPAIKWPLGPATIQLTLRKITTEALLLFVLLSIASTHGLSASIWVTISKERRFFRFSLFFFGNLVTDVISRYRWIGRRVIPEKNVTKNRGKVE